MADVKMPKSVPCKFDTKGWSPCKKPSDNGWCSKHEQIKCVSCGEHAVQTCDAGMGGLSCGALLCASCEHDYASGYRITKEAADEIRRKKGKKGKLRKASRTNPNRWINKKVVPATLFELLKGDWRNEGYELKKVYYLELSHGLMGFFPAIFTHDHDQIVFTADLSVLERVWQLLDRRPAKLQEAIAYVNQQFGVCYIEASPSERENREPQRLLMTAELAELLKTERPFRWAPGLIGGGSISREYYLIHGRPLFLFYLFEIRPGANKKHQ